MTARTHEIATALFAGETPGEVAKRLGITKQAVSKKWCAAVRAVPALDVALAIVRNMHELAARKAGS